MYSKSITLTIKGNQLPFSFTKTVTGLGTKFTAKFRINKTKKPTLYINNIKINQTEPENGWDDLEELDIMFDSIHDWRKDD